MYLDVAKQSLKILSGCGGSFVISECERLEDSWVFGALLCGGIPSDGTVVQAH